MTTATEHTEPKKKALRHNEYYNMQSIFDMLYESSRNDETPHNLMRFILSDENILLAYRNIKRNKGSKTAGVNKATIKKLAEMDRAEFVDMVKNRINNYRPNPVRRVMIPKANGKMRPLGIPTIEDRIMQQCIKQVLEPILEAKFYKHSYGFRPERSTKHAIARFENLAFSGYHYVVDIDVAGFFDNVNHAKLLKQLWTLGIKDKTLLKIISLMLKAEIEGEGIPEKGTPQGGILSPLLSNAVLNELDWWISGQWDEFPTDYNYTEQDSKYRALRKTKLKDIKIVRYADDFKIMCKDHKTAHKIFVATRKWLKERLGLDISSEKSKITNLRKKYSEFLGFKLKVKKGKGGKYTNRSHITDKAKERACQKIKDRIIQIQKSPTAYTVNIYNATVLGLHNYYKAATQVSLNFHEIAYLVKKSLHCRTKDIRADTGSVSETYQKFYGTYKYRKIFIAKRILFPIAGVKWDKAKGFSQEVCRYTEAGRETIHSSLKLNMKIVTYLMSTPDMSQTTEFNDNRISLYTGQMGKCYVTGEQLTIGNMEVHHKKTKQSGGTDEYRNLVFVTYPIHKLIHATNPDTIEEYKNQIKFDERSLKKLNKLRMSVGNDVITT